jgi:hypothetical protein
MTRWRGADRGRLDGGGVHVEGRYVIHSLRGCGARRRSSASGQQHSAEPRGGGARREEVRSVLASDEP